MPGVQSIGRWGNVMGGQDFTTDMYVEGIPITNAVVQGEGRNLSFGISVEAIDQFQVETSGTAVTFNGQGASNYVVKSGTNTFRARGSSTSGTGARRQGLFLHNQARRQPARIRRDARRPDPQKQDVLLSRLRWLPRPPAVRVDAVIHSDARAAQRRFQRAAGDDLRSAHDAAESERHRFHPRSISRQQNSCRPHLGDLESFQSYLPEPTNGALQNNYLGGSLPIGFNNDSVTAKIDLKVNDRQQGSLLFSHGKRSQATAYRGSIAPLAAAVHGHPAGSRKFPRARR